MKNAAANVIVAISPEEFSKHLQVVVAAMQAHRHAQGNAT